ncbi:hypothetical protein CY35_16G041400 [Sphagnum magellanicum]|nr:hypothetical protein CY35_16G041400 [Sphagnum magellanicum]
MSKDVKKRNGDAKGRWGMSLSTFWFFLSGLGFRATLVQFITKVSATLGNMDGTSLSTCLATDQNKIKQTLSSHGHT